jgi:hypothetical protein
MPKPHNDHRPCALPPRCGVYPLDEHNITLLDNVHPVKWEDPTPEAGFEKLTCRSHTDVSYVLPSPLRCNRHTMPPRPTSCTTSSRSARARAASDNNTCWVDTPATQWPSGRCRDEGAFVESGGAAGEKMRHLPLSLSSPPQASSRPSSPRGAARARRSSSRTSRACVRGVPSFALRRSDVAWMVATHRRRARHTAATPIGS